MEEVRQIEAGGHDEEGSAEGVREGRNRTGRAGEGCEDCCAG